MKSIVLNFTPNFLTGLVKALDFGETMSVYDSSLPPEEVDKLSIALDWATVLEDLNGGLLK